MGSFQVWAKRRYGSDSHVSARVWKGFLRLPPVMPFSPAFPPSSLATTAWSPYTLFLLCLTPT